MDFSQFNRDVLLGHAGGRIIWQPRIGCWYDDRLFAGKALPEPYAGLTLPQIYRRLGCSARLYEFNASFERVEDPRVTITETQLNDTDRQWSYDTPVGRQVMVLRSSPNNPHPIYAKWEVETKAELHVAIWREQHSHWHWRQDVFERLQNELGDLGAPCIFLPRMNVQSLYLEKMGIERGAYALYDWRDTVEAYFDALEQNHQQLIELVNASAVEIVNFGENVHSATLSPELFRRYHLPVCQRRCEALHAAGKFVYSHWDGDCGPLLGFARETGMDGIEAITPRPQGDVTLDEIKDALGDELFLLDGIPAVYFDETYTVDTLVACVHRLIDLFAPKLVLGISDEISSTGLIERVSLVGEIVEQYNANV